MNKCLLLLLLVGWLVSLHMAFECLAACNQTHLILKAPGDYHVTGSGHSFPSLHHNCIPQLSCFFVVE